MQPEPLRTIFLGYATAALGAAGLGAFGFGLIPALLVAWIGGAGATLALAAIGVKRRAAASVDASAASRVDVSETDVIADLLRWEQDGAADAAAQDRRKGTGHGQS